MRKGLDQRQPVFAGANLAFEDRQKRVARGRRGRKKGFQPIKGRDMVFDQLLEPCWQAVERQFVPRQDEVIFPRQRLEQPA